MSLEYAHIGRRLLADICDIAISIVLALVAALSALLIFNSSEAAAHVANITWFLWFFGNATYSVGATGQSWGRRLLGVKVVDSDGRPVGFWRILGRNLFAFHVSALPLFLGFLWIAWDDKRRAWHDMALGTLVVDANT